MTHNEFKDILLNSSLKEKWDAFAKADKGFLNLDIFNILCDLLKHPDERIRFFSITQLIREYPQSLAENERLLDDCYSLLTETYYSPNSDRAIWALNIIGNKALDRLLLEYPNASSRNKIMIVFAVSRGSFQKRTADRVSLLLDALMANDERLKYIAMCELMNRSPLSPSQPNYDSNVDFENIYVKVVPIATAFSKSSNIDYQESANRYLSWFFNKV